MLESQDTVPAIMEAFPDLKNAVMNNTLFFKKRCRSRSFEESPGLLCSEGSETTSKTGEDFYGYGSNGQRFEFKPHDYSIVSMYTEIEKLFEDALSPTVVTLTKPLGSEKVSSILRITCELVYSFRI